MLKEVTKDIPNTEVLSFGGLTVGICRGMRRPCTCARASCSHGF